MKRLRSQHDCVKVEAGFIGVPTTVINSAEHLEQAHQVNAVGDGYSVLAVARENVVVVADAVARANLRSLLANRRSP